MGEAMRGGAEVAGHAGTAALRFFRRPPTELADGFGREECPTRPGLMPGAGFTPVLRWVPGSPGRATRRRPPDSPDEEVRPAGPGHGTCRYAVVTIRSR